MYMNKKAKAHIASLINYLEVIQMIRQDHDITAPGYYDSKEYSVTRRKMVEATLELGDTYGIYLPNYEAYKAAEEHTE